MSQEQLQAFIEKVKGDTRLQEKFKAAADSDAVLAIAKEAGFMITTEDLKTHRQSLSDDQLANATGGNVTRVARPQQSYEGPLPEFLR